MASESEGDFTLITCRNMKCKADLQVPIKAFRIYCPKCNSIFLSYKNVKGKQRLYD